MFARSLSFTLLCSLLGGAVPATSLCQDVTPPDSQAIAEVQAGGVQTAQALWWGFDPEDSTRQLQSALDSRARRIVVARMPSPWVVNTIRLPSDKQIVFERGAVVEAKRGAFLGKNDCLFTANECKNLDILGEETILRMHKADYHQSPYELAEWRHALSLRGCADVSIRGLILQDSGGDGVYLGRGLNDATNRNVTIRDVICDGNNRQGVSVITAENLLIEDCVFRNTRGTAPQAGIDFEPNRSDERLVNCVLRNCRSENNAGHAYHFYLGHMNEQSTPLSIRLERCTSTGCERYSTYLGMANREDRKTVRGSIDCIDCRFDGDAGGGVYVRGNEADGCRIELQRCEISRPVSTNRLAPITIEAPRRLEFDAGNVHLRECTIKDGVARRPLQIVASPMTALRNITGTIDYESPEGITRFTIDDSLLQSWFPDHGKVAKVLPYDFAWQRAEPLSCPRLKNSGSFLPKIRGAATMLVWGTAGQEWKLSVRMAPVGRHTALPGKVTVTTSDGRTARLSPTGDNGEFVYRFSPKQTGPSRLDWQGDSNTTLQPTACSASLAILDQSAGLRMIKPSGTLFFTVPKGVERFAVVITGQGTGETVRATLRDERGNLRDTQDNIGPPHVFLAERESADHAVLWSLSLEEASEGYFEDVTVQSLGISGVFAFPMR